MLKIDVHKLHHKKTLKLLESGERIMITKDGVDLFLCLPIGDAHLIEAQEFDDLCEDEEQDFEEIAQTIIDRSELKNV